MFNSSGLLLDSDTAAPRLADIVEAMTLSQPTGCIAWAVAYPPSDGDDFGSLDKLRFYCRNGDDDTQRDSSLRNRSSCLASPFAAVATVSLMAWGRV